MTDVKGQRVFNFMKVHEVDHCTCTEDRFGLLTCFDCHEKPINYPPELVEAMEKSIQEQLDVSVHKTIFCDCKIIHGRNYWGKNCLNSFYPNVVVAIHDMAPFEGPTNEAIQKAIKIYKDNNRKENENGNRK